MSRKRRRKRHRRPKRSDDDVRLTTPEGDEIVFTSALYRHTDYEDVLSILRSADDFGLDDDLAPESDGSYHFPWFETRADAPQQFAPLGKRVLAHLVLTPTKLEVEAPSRRRLDDCRLRLEELLGERIRLIQTGAKELAEALSERSLTEPEEPFVPPPELIAEMEDKMLHQWIDSSIPALGGQTPREAVKTPEGRRQVLELIEYSVQMQKSMPKRLGMFAPDYRKVKKMLDLE